MPISFHVQEDDQFRRLAACVLPRHYELTVRPDLEALRFDGRVRIELEVVEETTFIELNSLELSFERVELVSPSQGRIELDESRPVDYFKTSEIARIRFRDILRVQERVSLIVDFAGVLGDVLSGFFRTKCLGRDGRLENAAATQFESSHARKAFPCFDEPALKATFAVTVVAEQTKTVLSNMPLCEQKDLDDGRAEFRFDKTPVMSTYLVAFVVGTFDHVERKLENGPVVRVYTPVGGTRLGELALDITCKSLKFYAEYFGLEYPLPKLDLIGLRDLEIEAMENWGLLTYKESLVLIDTANCSVEAKAEIALVVAHEVAHQWFGNIVTMSWWTDLWLNEGFATWIEYLSVNYCLPEWDIWSWHANDHLYRALELDSLNSTHAIEVDVRAPEELNDIFDSISYGKGSCVIRMLNDYIGEESFVRGLRNYLAKYKYKNATTSDLWRELDLASGQPVGDIMRPWTREEGYPVVEVDREVTADQRVVLKLKQRRYYKTQQEDGAAKSTGTLWNIPITVVTRSSSPKPVHKCLMTGPEMEIDLGVLESADDDWIALNSNHVGFYRTKYSETMLESILAGLDKLSSFGSVLDKIGLLNDSFALAGSGDLPMAKLFKMVAKFKSSRNAHVWMCLIKNLEHVCSLYLNTDVFPRFKTFLKDLFAEVVSFVGYVSKPEDDELTLLLREKVTHFVAQLDDQDFASFARSRFAERQTNPIPSVTQKPIYTAVLRSAKDAGIVDEFISMYEEAKIPEEKERLALMLSQVTQPDLIQKVLEFGISNKITLEETMYLILFTAKNPTNKSSLPLSWAFVKANWSVIHAKFTKSLIFPRLIKPLIQNFADEASLKDVEEFFQANPSAELKIAVKQGTEIVKSNIAWINAQDIKDLDRVI